MCKQGPTMARNASSEQAPRYPPTEEEKVPVERLLDPPSAVARYSCAGLMVGVFAVWGKWAFVEDESQAPGVGTPVHSYQVPLILTVAYLASLPLLRILSSQVLSKVVDLKMLLRETMIVYNAGQVLLNAWMVYRFLHAVLINGHPFIGEMHNPYTGATYATWIHYADKYLEFFDTFFMVLRGRMDQVSFLHVYHHVSIAWAWWIGMTCWPGGDGYFGALLNSWIHVMMYSYYTLSLLKIPCPWKRYLTQAQLLQFTSVIVYSVFSTQRIYQQQGDVKFYVALGTQVFEMVSLFVLFMNFYSKAYSKKKGKSSKSTSSSTSSDTVPEHESIDSESTADEAKKDS